VTANGTAAQIALMGDASTTGKMKFTEQLLVQTIILLSGGTDNVVYRASVGYANLNGILKG
jgi:iron complex outermembrane receptor protein